MFLMLLVTTKCIQYEKGAVIFNVGSIYSQLAANQPFKTSEGKKKAATYFQKASSVFLYCRDSIITRFRVKMDKTNTDLSENALSALSEIMLGQAVECFYEKANEGSLSLF
jgi:programmed cell death 6-interacting protein